MTKRLCQGILRLSGWTLEVTLPDFDKCVICVAPHTSNWDFIWGKLAYGSLGRKAGFLMKKEWFFFPLGSLFRAMGGIAVDRKSTSSLTDQLAARFARSRSLHLAITPEATRKPNPDWKKGFYYIALKAKVPILLIGIDYPSKTIACLQSITPSGNYDQDIREIKQYFTHFRGKKPQNFAL